MKLLYGKPVAEKILTRLKRDIFQAASKPGLAVVLVGDDAASHIYVNLKEKAAQEIGMNFFRFQFSKDISEEELLVTIANINSDGRIHGIIVQLPLPAQFDTQKIIDTIDPQKDVDGFHPVNVQKMLTGQQTVAPVFPQAIMSLLESSGEGLVGKEAIVVANSAEFGETMCAVLRQQNISSEYMLSSEFSQQVEKIKEADIVVTAVGKPGLISGAMLKEGAIVIDGGIEKVGNKVVGDIDFASTEGRNGYITPVPKGVGPVTIACLLENVYLAFVAQQKQNRD